MASNESTPERRLPGIQEDAAAAAESRGRWQARDVADTPPTCSGYSNSCRAARDVWQQTHKRPPHLGAGRTPHDFPDEQIAAASHSCVRSRLA